MLDNKVVKKSDIKVSIGLNKDKVPVDIDWQNEDNPNGPEAERCKAVLLSFFDRKTLSTLKVDLWTADMQVHEMDQFFYETLSFMAGTYERATQNKKLASEMRQFIKYFGEQTKIIEKSDQ